MMMCIPKKIRLLLFLCLLGASTHAQDVYVQEDDETAEAFAARLTEVYQPELVMTGEQLTLFQKKLEEFLIREEKIRRMDLSAEDKIHVLRQLSEQENREMTDILRRPQWRRYAKIKDRIRPITVVVKDSP